MFARDGKASQRLVAGNFNSMVVKIRDRRERLRREMRFFGDIWAYCAKVRNKTTIF